MAQYIDKSFINRISAKLTMFHWVSETLANCRCPLCGDSSRNKYKARGYFYVRENGFRWHCHNCNVDMGFQFFLKKIAPEIYREYLLETFGEKIPHRKKKEQQYDGRATERLAEISNYGYLDSNAEKISDLKTNHFAKKYLDGRKIPTQFYSELYYVPDFKKFIDGLVPGHEHKLYGEEPRIIIPFYDRFNVLTLVQGRALSDTEKSLRYIAVKVVDNSKKIYGLNRHDRRHKTYIVEGPFDSLFLDNGIAAGDSNLVGVAEEVDRERSVFILDNEKRNAQIVKSMARVVDFGFPLFIWPEKVEEKDVNDMIKKGLNSADIMHIIDANTFTGLEAKFRIQTWSKS